LVSRELFTRYVKDALAHFRDPVRFQTNPLVALLQLQDGVGETPAASLRQLLTEAVESLRPMASIPMSDPEWRGYRLMLLRYLRSYTNYATCEELGFSIATFYRLHREALEAIVGILWQRYQEVDTLPGKDDPANITLSLDQQAKEEAIRLAREARREPVNLDVLLDKTRRMIEPLASRRGLVLEIDAPPTLPTAYGDKAMLRQILLNVLTEGISIAAGPTLELAVSVRDDKTWWRLRGLDESRVSERQFKEATGIAVSLGLLDVYGGRIWFERDPENGSILFFTIPLGKPGSVLIIDDDVETLRLYRRYLQAHDYAVRTAHDAAQLKAHLDTALPDLVLLDVLMPQEDGWDILQYLKTDDA